MSNEQERQTILITPCPLCLGSHRYNLVFRRTTVLSALKLESRHLPRKFTRIFTCPIKLADFQSDLSLPVTTDQVILSLQVEGSIVEAIEDEQLNSETKDQIVAITNASEVSPHNRAVYESGKSLLMESVSIGREFSKFMITVSTSAIPIYLGILTFLLPKAQGLGFRRGLIAISPLIGFLISAIIFTIGYFPVISEFSLDIIDDIERARENMIRVRVCRIRLGFSVFILSTLGSIIVIIVNLYS